MLRTAEQVRWVPMSEITGWEEEAALPPPSTVAALEGRDAVLLLQREAGGYQLVAGRERLLEMRAQGQSCVNAVISPRWNLEERISALLTQLLQGKLHYVEEALAYQELLQRGPLSKPELAARLGCSQAALQRKLRLLSLGEGCRQVLRENPLSERHALAVLRIPGEQGRQRILAHAAAKRLSVKETEALVEETLARMPIPMPKERKMIPLMRDHRLYVNAIRSIVEQMRDAGLEAEMLVTPHQSWLEVRVQIPCFSQPQRKSAR